MKTFLLCLFLTFLCGVFSQTPAEPKDSCSLCTTIVDNLESFLVKNNVVKNKENIMKGIEEIEKKVCSILPSTNSDGITKDECLDYLRLYAPYVVDLFLANTDPSKICSGLGLCGELFSTPSSTNYDVVLPSLKEHSVEYLVPTTKVGYKGQQFFYKMFLANPTFLHEDMMAVELIREDLSACSLALEITNRTTYLYTTICSPTVSNCKCMDYVIHPGRGVWYYATITAHQMFNRTKCFFSLKTKVQNIPMTERAVNHFLVIPVIMPLLCCSLLCCCCCIARRRCRRSGACKWKCQRMCKTNDKSVSVDLQPMPTPTGDAQPIGYYYVPNAFGGQYIAVSQDPQQQFAYPQFVTVQQE